MVLHVTKLLLFALSVASLTSGLYFTASHFQTQSVLGESTLINSTTDSTTTTSTLTTSTTATYSQNIALIPSRISLDTLSKTQFRLVQTFANGDRKEIPADTVNWTIIKGGGRISTMGEFQAWDVVGLYPNTVEARYNGSSFYASVEVVASSSVTPSTTTNTSFTSSPSPKPSPSPSPSPKPSLTPPPTASPTQADAEQNDVASQTTSVTEDLKVQEKSLPSVEPSTALPTLKPVTFRSIEPEKPRETEPIISKPRFQAQGLKACLLATYTGEEYSRYFDPTGDRVSLIELGDRAALAEVCFAQQRIPNVTQDSQTCLEQNLGERYQSIAQGGAGVNRYELHLASSCFTEPQKVSFVPQAELDTNSLTCLEVKIGSQAATAIAQQTRLPQSSELFAMRECFGMEKNSAIPSQVEAPQELLTCLSTGMSEDRIRELQLSGKPTEQEVEVGRDCFQRIDVQQRTALPTPSQLVPLLPVASDTAKLTHVQLAERESKNTVILSGAALPNALVDIHIFSEPMVVTTTTDANGNWTYELYYHLPEGDHTAYAVTTHPTQGTVRSEVFSFAVAYAQAEVGDGLTIPTLTSVSPIGRDQIKIYVGIALLLISLGTAAVLVLIHFRAGSAMGKTTVNAVPDPTILST